MINHHTLDVELAQSGDPVAQVEALLKAAQIAEKEHSFGFAQGLCGQAWALSARSGYRAGLAKSRGLLAKAMQSELWFDSMRRTASAFAPGMVQIMYERALALCEDIDDLRQRIEAYCFIAAFLRDNGLFVIALKGQLACYQALNDVPAQAKTLTALYLALGQSGEGYHAYVDCALLLYQQLGDARNQAFAHYHQGRGMDWQKEPERAHEVLHAAQCLFAHVNDYGYVIQVFITRGKLILLTEGYKACCVYYQQSIEMFAKQPLAAPYLDLLWHTWAALAHRHEDFDTERTIYQRLLSLCASSGDLYKQARLYWKWGTMEFFDARRKSMGYALCRWAMTLLAQFPQKNSTSEQYFVEMSRYHRQMRRMERAINILWSKQKVFS